MIDKRINVDFLKESFGCDNCSHKNCGEDGYYHMFCEKCEPGYRLGIPPTKYRPIRNTIYEKAWKGRYDLISYREYCEFLKSENSV